MNNALLILDLIGTFAFAITGCYTAIKHELDVLGLTILALCTAVGGGIIRDTLLGLTPATAFLTYTHVSTCALAIIIVLIFKTTIAKRWNLILLTDALGLSVFTLFGCLKASQYSDVNCVAIVFFGVITAVGGGIIRDLLVNEISSVLKRGFYASSAILGGITFCILSNFHVNISTIFICVIIITFISRILSLKLNFELTKISKLEKSPTEMTTNYNRWK